MTEHKITDDEVIKALEHCRNGDRGSKCSKCEYVTGCKTWLIGLALDLINRQRAEIERLNYCRETNISSIAELHRRLLTAKTEAIKEFAERLKEELRLSTGNNGGFVPSMIDNLVKETTEGEQ